jgi:hypothetical protein
MAVRRRISIRNGEGDHARTVAIMKQVTSSGDAWWLPLAFLMTSVIPSVIFMRFATSSMATGTTICDLAWIGLGLYNNPGGVRWTRREWQLFGVALLILTLLFIHGMIVEFWFGGVNFARLAGSGGILLIKVLAAYVIALRLLATTPQFLASIGRFAFVTLTIMGFGAVAGIPSVNSAFPKAVIVFSEPSHFSFVYLPVLIFVTATTTRGRQLWYLGSGLALTGAMENLTLLVGILGASCLILSRTQLVLLLGVLIGALGFLALDLSYYTDRLLLSADSDNLSTLVYLQGWQRAALNLSETHGLGVGFQQFGVVGSLGSVLEKIIWMNSGGALNLYDGGSTGSKLIGELGAVGIALILMYLSLVVRGVRLIRLAQRLPVGMRDVRRIFFYSFIVAYASELFIRGNGYMSPSDTLLLASLIALRKLGFADRPLSATTSAPALAGSPVPT